MLLVILFKYNKIQLQFNNVWRIAGCRTALKNTRAAWRIAKTETIIRALERIIKKKGRGIGKNKGRIRFKEIIGGIKGRSWWIGKNSK